MRDTFKFSKAELLEAKALWLLLEGATTLCLMAEKIETACAKAPKEFVMLRKSDLVAIARSQRLSATMIDLLAQGIERGESLPKTMGLVKA